MKPTIGRIVIYRLTDAQEVAALVTAVHSEDYVSLQLFPVSHGERTSVRSGDAAGEWRWPPRV